MVPPQVLLLNSRSSWFFTNLCRMCAQSCLSRLYRQKTNLYSSKRTYQWEITFSNRKYSYTSSFMVVFHCYVCLPSVESKGSSVLFWSAKVWIKQNVKPNLRGFFKSLKNLETLRILLWILIDLGHFIIPIPQQEWPSSITSEIYISQIPTIHKNSKLGNSEKKKKTTSAVCIYIL